MRVLTNLVELAGLVAGALTLLMALHLLLVLVWTWREAADEPAHLQVYGPPSGLRAQLGSLLLTGLLSMVVWPFGAFAVLAPVAEWSLGWYHQHQRREIILDVPSEGHAGVALWRVASMTALGGALAALPAFVWTSLAVPELVRVWLGALLPITFGTIALVRASQGRRPELPYVAALVYGVHRGEPEAPADGRVAEADRRHERQLQVDVGAQAADAARPVADEAGGGESAARDAAQALAKAAIEAQLASILRAERKRAAAAVEVAPKPEPPTETPSEPPVEAPPEPPVEAPPELPVEVPSEPEVPSPPEEVPVEPPPAAEEGGRPVPPVAEEVEAQVVDEPTDEGPARS